MEGFFAPKNIFFSSKLLLSTILRVNTNNIRNSSPISTGGHDLTRPRNCPNLSGDLDPASQPLPLLPLSLASPAPPTRPSTVHSSTAHTLLIPSVFSSPLTDSHTNPVQLSKDPKNPQQQDNRPPSANSRPRLPKRSPPPSGSPMVGRGQWWQRWRADQSRRATTHTSSPRPPPPATTYACFGQSLGNMGMTGRCIISQNRFAFWRLLHQWPACGNGRF